MGPVSPKCLQRILSPIQHSHTFTEILSDPTKICKIHPSPFQPFLPFQATPTMPAWPAALCWPGSGNASPPVCHDSTSVKRQRDFNVPSFHDSSGIQRSKGPKVSKTMENLIIVCFVYLLLVICHINPYNIVCYIICILIGTHLNPLICTDGDSSDDLLQVCLGCGPSLDHGFSCAAEAAAGDLGEVVTRQKLRFRDVFHDIPMMIYPGDTQKRAGNHGK